MAADIVASLLAHQGGWDEILFVLAPLGILAGLLLMARRRVDELGEDDDDRLPADTRGPDGPPTG